MCCRMRACCYVVPLRTGAVVIGSIDIIVKIIILSVALVQVSSKDMNYQWSYVVEVMFAILVGILLVFGILMLIGAIWNKTQLVKPWICVTCCTVCGVCGLIGHLIHHLATGDKSEDAHVVLLTAYSFAVGAGVYALCIVHSFLEERGAARSKATCPC